MESIEQFKNNVKNDERRLKFFVDKLKTDLKRINIQYDDETLKELILNAIEKYNDHPHGFGNYLIKQIKQDNKDKAKYPKNDTFNDSEMAIIDLYLTKDNNGQYKSSEEIAQILGVEILQVSSTVYKLKTELAEHPKNIEKIFGDIEPIITEHRKIKPKRRIKKQESKNTELTDDDMKILGSFTGQINDICIDIEDLASERDITPQKMQEKIVDLYDLLENEENYKKLITKFPQITLMLKLKGKAIGAKIPIIVTTNGNPVFECANFFQTLYQKDDSGKYVSIKTAMNKLGYTKEGSFYSRKKVLENKLEEDSDFKRKVIERYPTLFEDKEQYEQRSSVRNNSNKKTKPKEEVPEEIKQDVKLLKYFYKLHDGKYYSESIIAELMEMNTSQVIRKKDKILKRMKNTKKYETQILNQYPELYKNIEVYNNASDDIKNGGISPKVIAADIKYLRLMYSKNPSSNKYRSSIEIADELEISMNTFYKNRKRILYELDNNPEYKTAITKEWPLLNHNIEMYNKDKDNKKTKAEEERKRKEEEKINELIKTLEYFYKKQENGKYLSTEEIAALLEIKETSMYAKQRQVLKKLDDQEIKKKILEKWPTLDDDIRIKNKAEEETKEKENAKQKAENERKKKEAEDKKNEEKINDLIKTLEYFYKKQENGKYLSNKEIAKLLKIGEKSSIYQRRINNLRKLEDQEIRKKVLEKWPTLDEDIKTRDKAEEAEKETEKINDLIKTLEYFYKKQENGKYLSTEEIAALLEIKEKSTYARKDLELKKLEDQKIRKKVLEKWPTLFEDIKTRDKAKEAEKETEKINDLIKTLEYFYKKQENGRYLSTEEIAALLEIKETSMYARKDLELKKLEDQKIRKKVLEKWPTLFEDIKTSDKEKEESGEKEKAEQKAENERKKKEAEDKKNEEKINDFINTLEYFYKKQENGKYFSISEIAAQLELKETSVNAKQKQLLKKLENKELKKKVLEKWPTLDKDIEARANESEPPKLTEKEKLLADILLTDENRTLEKGVTYARYLDISANYFSILKNKTVAKISNNPILQNDYPHFMEENEIAANYSKRNTISLSQEELNNIRNNARKYDLPNTKRNTKDDLIKGIEKLEKSVYGDYASLCTVEQKAMLALRLGFFNNTEFSTETVSIFFMTDQEEVSQLTSECIKSAKKAKATRNVQKKIGTKN